MAISIRADPQNRLIRAHEVEAHPARIETPPARPVKAEAAMVMFRGEEYHGEYVVTPAAETQVLLTNGLQMTGDITINPIPNNYGLIQWNGAVLTIS